MRNKIKKQIPEKNMPFAEKEELKNLIKEMMTNRKVKDLLKEGLAREQITYVVSEKKKCDEQDRVIGKTIDTLTWVFPGFK